jgi:uncharacterized iron-regulated membrane protein
MRPSVVRAWSAVHTWTSLVCTLFMLVACVTGLAMIWIGEIDAAYAGHPPPAPAPAGAVLADLDRVFADARARTPGEQVTYADWAFDGVLLGVNMVRPGEPRVRRQLVYDARSGAFMEDTRKDNPDQPVRVFLRIMNRLHIELFAGQNGEYVLAFMGVLFVFATVSGVVLYAPFTRKLGFGAVRVDKSARARWLDIHNLVGVATVGWVLVVSVTGVMNAFTVPAYAAWRKQTVPTLVAPYKGAAPEAARISAMQAVEAAHRALPGGRMVRITPPGGKDGSPRHYVVWTQGASPVTSKLFRPILVEAQTGEVVLSAPPPWWLSALQLSRPLHFGNYGGAPLKVLWSLLDLAAIAILASGVWLWVARRFRRAAA